MTDEKRDKYCTMNVCLLIGNILGLLIGNVFVHVWVHDIANDDSADIHEQNETPHANDANGHAIPKV